DVGEGHSTIQVNLGPDQGYRLEWQLDRIAWAYPQSSHRGDYAAMWWDLDNDGWQDLVMAQGSYEDARDKLFVLRQNEDAYFDDITAALGLAGTDRIPSPGATTVLDYDRDGDDDVIANLAKEDNRLLLLRNDVGNAQYHLGVKLVPPPGVNGSAIGARVVVTAGDLVQTRELFSGQGHFANQQPLVLNFGLGGHHRVDRIEVRWPSLAGETWVLDDVAADQLLVIGPDPPAPPPTDEPALETGCGCAAGAATGAPFFLASLLALRRRTRG
ncbi:MAG: ASPIC/UnbV domain-containing protein, partial [Deltaproteobacteria bacterium]|nr:ASPIC/UnbV domain-containing protein [Deltaproteobacteria bacterium]